MFSSNTDFWGAVAVEGLNFPTLITMGLVCLCVCSDQSNTMLLHTFA